MIKINPSKEKTLTFSLEVEGIDPKLLKYTLRLTEGTVEYGFKGENKNGEVVVTIPPLSSIVKMDKIDKIDTIKLEIHDSNNKYFMMPFEDTVLIEKEPVLMVTMTEEKEEAVESKIQVRIKSDSDKTVAKPVKTNSRISRFLEDK